MKATKHIQRAIDLYENLINYRSKFITEHAISKYRSSLKCDTNYLLFLIIYDHINKYHKGMYVDRFNFEIKIDFEAHYCFQDIDEKYQIETNGSILIVTAKEKLHDNISISQYDLSGITKLKFQTIYKIIEFVNSLITDTGHAESEEELKLISGEIINYQNKIIADNFNALGDYVFYTSANTPLDIIIKGANNLGCKIFNEFCLSLNKAEYLLVDDFSENYLIKFKELFHSIFKIDDSGDESNEKLDRFIIPALIENVSMMASRYMEFCQRIRAQLHGRPSYHTFFSSNKTDALLSLYPEWNKRQFLNDNSKVLAQAFDTLITVDLIDHQYSINDSSLSQLIDCKEILEYTYGLVLRDPESVSGNKSDWKITKEEITRLIEYKSQEKSRHTTTLTLLKLSLAKVETLLWKVSEYFCHYTARIESKIVPPSVFTQEPTISYNSKVIKLQDLINDQIIITPIVDEIDSDESLGRRRISSKYSDLSKYNDKVQYIQENHKWFEQKKSETSNYKNLTHIQSIEYYNEYMRIKRAQNRHENEIFFFCEIFLCACINSLMSHLDRMLREEKTKNSTDEINEFYDTLGYLRLFIDELKKLSKFCLDQGYTHNKQYFENSFFVFDHDRCIYCKADQQINGEYLCEDIPNNFIFISSTYYFPTFPSRLLDMYEYYVDQKWELTNKAYIFTPETVINHAKNEINEISAKERRNTIQILGLFAAILAFVTSSVGASKLFETTEEYAKFASVFILSLISIVVVVKYVTFKKTEIKFRHILSILLIPIFIVLMIIDMHFAGVVVGLITCLSITVDALVKNQYREKPKKNSGGHYRNNY